MSSDYESDYDHQARADDSNEPGNYCKDCGEPVVWLGPSQYDWIHIEEQDMPKNPATTIIGMMALKWVIIFGVTRALRKAIEKA